jgi:PAS domain S-box-containing protein
MAIKGSSRNNTSAPFPPAREKLRLNQASLEAAQAQARLGNWQYDPLTDRGVWSREMFHLFGRDPALGQPRTNEFFELVHPDDRAALLATQNPDPAKADRCEAHIRTNPERGPVRHLHLIVHVVRTASGKIRYLAGTVQDETDRRLAEAVMAESEARYRALFENNPAPMLIYERSSLQLLAVNDAFLRHYGYSRDEATALLLTDLYPEVEKSKIAAIIPDLHGYANVGEWHHVRRDGSLITIVATSHDLNYAGRVARVAVLNDITEQKRAEEALRRLNSELEERVAERTAELAVARDRAEAADRLKSAFLATMSHELRTPLNSIIGFTGIILQGLAGPLNVEQTKQLAMVRSSARHLLSLINDVLDISKIEAGQLEIMATPFDLRESVAKMTGLVQPLAQKKNLALHVSVTPAIAIVVADQRRIEQVLLNLLNNAVKFTERGEVGVSAEVTPPTGGDPAAGSCSTLRLVVRDTGIGIKAEDIKNLFQPFRQIDSGITRQHEGTGLGLAICRRLVALMKGEIRVESEWGRGSTFTVTIPFETNTPDFPVVDDP